MRNITKIGLLFTCLLLTVSIYGQKLVESVSGIVGNDVIYLSEVESQVLQLRSGGDFTPVDILRCRVYEDLLVQKLFLDQARIDSIVVSDSNIEGDLDMRLNNFIRTAGAD